LILDEATSALDVQTEATVLHTIRSLQGSITMVIIAHRLSALEGCDSVVEIDKASAVMKA
jgi:ABC-type bacteriocin/lantibiotic exporter with double-glycine peptidase domain